MKNKRLSEIIKERVLIFDGAMGTSIQKFNLTPDDFEGKEGCNEWLSVVKPDVISQIHASFLDVGCQVIETNTFGATRIVLEEYGLQDKVVEINQAAAQLAKDVCASYSSPDLPRFVSGSIGPGTKLPSLGHISFDELKDAFLEQAIGLIRGGVDVFQIETGQDMLQLKAALLGVQSAMKQEGTEIPVIVQVTMEQTGRMLLGTDINAVISTFEPFPLFGLGLNCATGPKAMSEHIRNLSQFSPFPISVLPNAGLPKLIDGEYKYDLSPGELAQDLAWFVEEFGVQMVGGCCGTTPDHLKAVCDVLSSVTPGQRSPQFSPSASSTYIAQPFHTEPKPLLIGERTNANGSKKFRGLLLNDDIDGMVDLALEQQAEQSHILDVCVAYTGRDEAADMDKLLFKLNTMLEIPVMIDSTEVNVMEAALKRIAGRCLLNSVNLEDGGVRAEKVLNLAKQYGAAVVALTIDETGMARTVEDKLKVAEKLYDLIVNKYGLRPSDIFFDPLTFTLASGDKDYESAGIATLNAITELKKRFPDSFTLLGLSNISFGLKPGTRHFLNSVFLYHAVQAGLDAAILHAGKIIPLDRIPDNIRKLCEDLIFNRRTDSYDPLHELLTLDSTRISVDEKEDQWNQFSLEEKLKQHIVKGRKSDLRENLDAALKSWSPMEIINRYLLGGMQIVGELFGEGKMQLPFVLKSAEVMKEAVAYLEQFMEKSDKGKRGKMVLATVKGDVHDIGKNLVDIILSNNGYEVINLGIKQSVENIIQAIEKFQPDCVGMSGLLVKSTVIMKENLQIFNERNISIPVICGGAALNRRFVEEQLKEAYRGKVYYGRDAMTGLQLMDRIVSTQEETEIIEGVPVNSERKFGKSSLRVATDADADQIDLRFDHSIPEPPFLGQRIVEGIPVDAVLSYLNKRILIKGRWQFKKTSDAHTPDFDPEKMLDKLIREGLQKKLFDFKVVYGYFRAGASGKSSLLVENPESRTPVIFDFPSQNKPPYLNLSKYFLPAKNELRDVVAFHLVTVGRTLSDYVSSLYKDNQYFNYLLWHGLSVELAEALAEYWHKEVRRELKIDKDDAPDPLQILKGNYRGRRYSFGYPACPNLEDQQKIFMLLKPEEIGVELTEEYQLVPEQSTSAIIVHHPQARYFAV
ncbi:MAG: methionine synthase [Calditrichia bacterium]